MIADRDFYEVLGVPANASAGEIHDAYYRAVRKHPPERDGEGFRRVQAAYEILKSPTARQEYDDARDADPETGRLIEEGRRLLEDEDQEATKPLMRAFARRPESLVVGDLLIQAFMVAGQELKAARLAKRLIDRVPNSPTYHLRLAQAYRRMNRNEDALKPLETSVGLAKGDPWPTVELAYLYRDMNSAERAVELLNGAIHHDGMVDFDDFIFFQALCRIYIGEGQLDELERVHRKVSNILPPDRDTRAYVAWFYYTDALAMAEGGHYTAGLKTIEEAATIDDSLPDLHAIKERFRRSHGLVVQYEALMINRRIIDALRVAVGAHVFCLLYGSNEQTETTLQRAVDEIGRLVMIENSGLADGVRIIRRRYPRVYEALTEWLDGLEALNREAEKLYRLVKCYNCQAEMVLEKPTATDSVQQRHGYFTCDGCGAVLDEYGRQPSQVDTARSGGCFVVTAACGSASAYPVVVLRRFRDQRLNACLMGRVAIWTYSRIGPVAARMIRSHGTLRRWMYWIVVRTAYLVDG